MKNYQLIFRYEVVFGNRAHLHSKQVISISAASNINLLLVIAFKWGVHSLTRIPVTRLPGVKVSRRVQNLHCITRHVHLNSSKLSAVDQDFAVQEGAGV